MSLPCIAVFDLPEFQMIAGSHKFLEFEVYKLDGVTPVDLDGMLAKVVISPYGQHGYTVLQKNCDITLPNYFSCNLLTNDTYDFQAGKYILQPIIIDVTGQEVRLGQGTITVVPRIPTK